MRDARMAIMSNRSRLRGAASSGLCEGRMSGPAGRTLRIHAIEAIRREPAGLHFAETMPESYQAHLVRGLFGAGFDRISPKMEIKALEIAQQESEEAKREWRTYMGNPEARERHGLTPDVVQALKDLREAALSAGVEWSVNPERK